MSKQKPQTQEQTNFYEERVPLLLTKPADVPSGSAQTITINGKNYQVMYDEEVMVPRKVKLVLEEKLKNEKKTELRIANLAGRVQSLDGE